MKVLAVLVLAIFTGCHANLFHADAPKPQLEVMLDTAKEYIATNTNTAFDTLQMIKKSQYGKDISDRLKKGFGIAIKYVDIFEKQLSPEARDLLTKLTTTSDELTGRVFEGLDTVRTQLNPHVEKIAERVEQGLAPYVESVDTEGIRNTLMQMSDQLKVNLQQSVKAVQDKLEPYTEDMQQKVDVHLQDFKERVIPVAEKVQTELIQRAQQVKEMAAPHVDTLRGRLHPYVENLQAQITSLYESLANTN